MDRKLAALLAISTLALPLSAGAIERSHSCTVKQNEVQGSWTAYGSIDAKGIDPQGTYTGHVSIQYGDDMGGGATLVSTVFTVGPGNKKYKFESPGLYSVTAALSRTAITVNIQATRYGPLTVYDYTTYQVEAGEFVCTLNIAQGTGEPYTVIHTAAGRERVWFYR